MISAGCGIYRHSRRQASAVRNPSQARPEAWGASAAPRRAPFLAVRLGLASGARDRVQAMVIAYGRGLVVPSDPAYASTPRATASNCASFSWCSPPRAHETVTPPHPGQFRAGRRPFMAGHIKDEQPYERLSCQVWQPDNVILARHLTIHRRRRAARRECECLRADPSHGNRGAPAARHFTAGPPGGVLCHRRSATSTPGPAWTGKFRQRAAAPGGDRTLAPASAHSGALTGLLGSCRCPGA
jgi:hypothetical protein